MRDDALCAHPLHIVSHTRHSNLREPSIISKGLMKGHHNITLLMLLHRLKKEKRMLCSALLHNDMHIPRTVSSGPGPLSSMRGKSAWLVPVMRQSTWIIVMAQHKSQREGKGRIKQLKTWLETKGSCLRNSCRVRDRYAMNELIFVGVRLRAFSGANSPSDALAASVVDSGSSPWSSLYATSFLLLRS